MIKLPTRGDLAGGSRAAGVPRNWKSLKPDGGAIRTNSEPPGGLLRLKHGEGQGEGLALPHRTRTVALLNRHHIRKLALQLINENPAGLRFAEIINQIKKLHPETPANSISGAIWNLDKTHPKDVVKPSKGLYVALAVSDSTANLAVHNGGVSAATSPITVPPVAIQIQEQQFYKPFAEFLGGELSEVIVAEPLGGAGLGKKWGTPDVVGVYKPLASDRIKFELEIVSAEIKIDPQESVTAFGQAIAYRLFSAKVYVVMPSNLPKDDQSRLEALCMLFGVGFVIFDLNVNNPNFITRVRAQRSAPDMFYVNSFADQLYKHNPTLFQKLF